MAGPFTADEDIIIRAGRMRETPLSFDVIAQQLHDWNGVERTGAQLSTRWRAIKSIVPETPAVNDIANPATGPSSAPALGSSTWRPWSTEDMAKLRELVEQSPEDPDWKEISNKLRESGVDRSGSQAYHKWVYETSKELKGTKKSRGSKKSAGEDEPIASTSAAQQATPPPSSPKQQSPIPSTSYGSDPVANSLPPGFEPRLLAAVLSSFGAVKTGLESTYQAQVKDVSSTLAQQCFTNAADMALLPQRMKEEVEKLQGEAKEKKQKIAQDLHAAITRWEEEY